MGITPPVAQITTIEDKDHQDNSYIEAYQDNTKKLDKTHHQQGNLALVGMQSCEEGSSRKSVNN